jgi:hypothetical protein
MMKSVSSLYNNSSFLLRLRSSSTGQRLISLFHGLRQFSTTFTQPSSQSSQLLTLFCLIFLVISRICSTILSSSSQRNAFGCKNHSICVTRVAVNCAGSFYVSISNLFLFVAMNGVTDDDLNVITSMRSRSYNRSLRHPSRQLQAM